MHNTILFFVTTLISNPRNSDSLSLIDEQEMFDKIKYVLLYRLRKVQSEYVIDRQKHVHIAIGEQLHFSHKMYTRKRLNKN